jgi:hypothetical protein
MEDDILRAATAEAERLEVLLHDQPLYQRLQAVRRIIDLYQEPLPMASIAPQTPPSIKRRGSRAGSQAEAIREGTAQFLRQKGARATSGEIYEALRLEGINVVGKKPSAVVASYLSHSDMFDCTSEGYGLREPHHSTEAETPNSGTLSGAPKINGAEPLNP